jgi:hypothetical protein
MDTTLKVLDFINLKGGIKELKAIEAAKTK